MEIRRLSIPLLLPNSGECENCAERLKHALLQTPGVSAAEIDLDQALLTLSYDPDLLSLEILEEKARRAGLTVGRQYRHETLRLVELDCPDCARTIEKGLTRQPGIIWASASVPAQRLLVEYDSKLIIPRQIAEAVAALGFPVSGGKEPAEADFRQKLRQRRRLLLTASCGLLIAAAGLGHYIGGAPFDFWKRLLFLLAAALGLLPILINATKSLRARSLDMNVLMTVAVLGAVFIRHESEAAAVVFLFTLGNALESYTLGKTRRALETLAKMTPERACVRRGEEEIILPTEAVAVGEIIIIRPGERIPLDGIIASGASFLDESAITGESRPVPKKEGEAVWAGSINQYGALEIQITRPASDSTLTRILALVETAEAKKTPSQRVIDRFAVYYTPAVILIALGLATLPSLLFGKPFAPWLYRSLTLLVVACPCALVIATPVVIVAALSAAAREGVLVKGGIYLEELARISALAFDKTGTLTYGKLRVTEIIGLDSHTQEEVLAVAAGVEIRSEHHLARAVLQAAAERGLTPLKMDRFEALPGAGACARASEQKYCVGNLTRLQITGLPEASPLLEAGKTVVAVLSDEQPIGLIGFSDVLRPEASEVIARLKALGLNRLVLLTGDNRLTSETVASQIGLTEWRAELRPEDKVAAIIELRKKWKIIAMLGDGINDAPALAAATVGIAMGAAGTDIARETSNVILLGDDLHRLPYIIALGKKMLAVMKQNIAFSLAVKLALAALAFPGWLTLWLAVVGDTGVSLLVTLNGMRLLSRKGSAAK